MSKPIVAVTPSTDTAERYHVTKPYFDVLESVGVIPVLLPMHPSKEDIADIAERFDGFLFAGGCDVAPGEYGEEVSPNCGEIQPDRDRLELELFREVMRLDKPCLAICRGCQVANVAAGGTLYQDIPSQFKPDAGAESIKHSQEEPSNVATHCVDVIPGSRLEEICRKKRFDVNSHHHQAVKDIGGGFKVSAVSPDGLIEAIERGDMDFCIGVQWHPEKLARNDDTQMAIFKAFAESCGKKTRG